MIDRAMKKKEDIQIFVLRSSLEKERYKQVDAEDHLTTEDWRVLAEVLSHLKPFHEMTIRLQSRAKEAHHGTIWEGLPCMEFLLDKIISAKQDHAARMAVEIAAFDENDEGARTNKHIATSLDYCWAKLDEYYRMLDDTPVYVAAIVLHPGQGWRYLELKWTTQKQRAWLQGAREAVQSLWEDVYKFTDSDLNQAPAHPSSSSSSSEKDDLATFMNPTNFYDTITTRD